MVTSLHDDVRLDVEEQVVVATAHLQQQGRVSVERLLQVTGAHQRLSVQLDDDVTVTDAPSEIHSDKQNNQLRIKYKCNFSVVSV